MIALIQRVTGASVEVEGGTVAAIQRGILALIGIEASDDTDTAARLLDKVLTYRIFPDEAGKMNLHLRQIGGDLLLVPQFTLVADTRKGTRPSFSAAAKPEIARELFLALVATARAAHPRVEAGIFGADMQVRLVNDGPVTFNLHVT
jgi:D-tyrosyl-tRNA(Tyr) deacylase